MNNRFVVPTQIDAPSSEANFSRIDQNFRQIIDQLNATKIPIVIGPVDKFPEGMLPGQPVIDWRSGVSQIKIWNGNQLV